MAGGIEVGSAYSIYRLNLQYLGQDTAAAKAQIRELQEFAQQQAAPQIRLPAPAAPASGGGASRGGDAAAQLEREQNAALSLAQARARLALVEGDEARALSVLRNAQTQNTAASERAMLGVQTQIARIESGKTAFQQFGESAKSSLLGIVGPAAAAGVAIATIKKTIDSFGEAIKFKAELDASKKSIDTLLRGVRDSGEVWAGAAKFANEYKLTQAETTEAIQASVRIIRSSKAPIEDILGAFARLKVLAPEKTFSDASRALSELQAGQVVSIEHLFNVPRRDANAMKKEIEGGADAVVVLNKYLDKTGVTMDAVKAQTTGAMGAMKDLAQAEERLKIAQANFAQGPGLAILNERISVTDGLTRLLTGDTQQMGQSFQQAALQGTTSFQTLLSALGPIGGALQQLADAAHAHQAAAQGDAQQTQQTAAVTAQSTGITSTYTNTINLQSQAMIDAAGATEKHRQAIAAQTDASVAQIEKTQASTEAANALAQMQAVLARLAASVAGGLLSDSQAAIVLANGYGIAYGKALQLIDAQAALARATAQVEHQKFVNENRDDLRGSRANAQAAKPLSSDFLADQKRRTDELRDSEVGLAKARGETAKETALLRQEQSQYAKGSAEWNKIEAQILDTEKSKAKKGAGGAAKLSDQQRLNNQLLNQQEKADQQFEDAALRHQKALLKIERDYQEKSLQQQKANEISKRRSRFDFYNGIQDLDTKSQQALSAEYEQAFAESQRIAQSGNHKLASEYLKLRQDQIAADKDYYAKRKEIEESDASKGEKAAQLRKLDDLRALRKQAEAEELKQLQEGGDAINNEHAKQLQDEADQYAEQTGKIETANARKAESTILSAERGKKKIDEERLSVQGLAGDYDKLGVAAQRRGLASTGGASASAPDTTPQQRAQTTADVMRVFDAAAVDAITAQTQMQSAKFDMLGGKLDAVAVQIGTVADRVGAVERAVRSSGRAIS